MSWKWTEAKIIDSLVRQLKLRDDDSQPPVFSNSIQPVYEIDKVVSPDRVRHLLYTSSINATGWFTIFAAGQGTFLIKAFALDKVTGTLTFNQVAIASRGGLASSSRIYLTPTLASVTSYRSGVLPQSIALPPGYS